MLEVEGITKLLSLSCSITDLLLGPQLVKRVPLAQMNKKLEERVVSDVIWANLTEDEATKGEGAFQFKEQRQIKTVIRRGLEGVAVT